MTALTSGIEQFLSVSVTDGTGETINNGLGAVAITADVTFAADDWKAYTSNTDADGDSELTAGVRALIAAVFAQSPRSQTVYVIARDVSGGETEAEALAEAETNGLRAPWDWAFLCTESRADADIVSAAGFCAGRSIKPIYFAQSDDADWLTSGVPSGFSSIVTNTQTVMLYEDTDATGGAEGWAGGVAGILADSQRPASQIEITNVLSEYGTLLTSTQYTNLNANFCNYHIVITPKGTRRQVRKGVVLTGATVALRFSVLYAEVEVVSALGELQSTLLAQKKSIPVNDEGEAQIRGALAPVFATMLAAGYITPDEALNLPDGYSLDITMGTATTVVATISYLGEVASIDFSGFFV